MLGMLALLAPGPAGAQTAAQRAREQEVRARMEASRARLADDLRALRQEQRALTGERRAQVEAQLQAIRQNRMAELEEALARARQAAADAGALSQERIEAAQDRLRAAQAQLRAAQERAIRLQTRIRLGVSLNARQGAELDRQGARLEGVMEDSPAQEAGLQEGDIITRLNGHSLLDPLSIEEEESFAPDESLPVQRLMALARELEPGQEVELQYLRDGSSHTATVEAADLEEPVIAAFPRGEGRIRLFAPGEEGQGFRWYYSLPRDSLFTRDSVRFFRVPELLENLRDSVRIEIPEIHVDSLRGFLYGVTPRRGNQPRLYGFREGSALWQPWSVDGLQLAEMNPGLGEYFSTEEGVLVLDVSEDSELGLEAGDVILAIDGRSVADPSDVRRILSSYEEGEAIRITVMRKGREVTVEGKG